MSSEDETVHRSGSTSNGEIQHSLGLILGQLAYLAHIPEKIDKLNREIGELKARLDILSAETKQNTQEIKNNTSDLSKTDGSIESRKIVISYIMSFLSLALSAVLVVLSLFSNNTTPTP
jgi:chromosome segregation ATPase